MAIAAVETKYYAQSLSSERQYFGVGVPGSFYDRLFPSLSLYFVHSSYALHGLSKVPKKLLDKNSSDEVMKACAAQLEKDMENFLDARAKEIVVGRMMILIMQSPLDNIDHSKTPAGVTFKFVEGGLMDMVKVVSQ
ncbi:unnamed protein product [Ilex paraguariensis]|uniref:Uncharacterized protein n=1 Tax=Ilex paraguariensis TaxID=185542 RepID=A0ABC8U799_9AQUA